MTLISIQPDDCSPHDIETFIRIAAKGDEVELADIERGVRRAHTLFWIVQDNAICAVAALKKPNESYCKRVFSKAGHRDSHEIFQLELGYIFVEETARHRGYAKTLVAHVIHALDGKAVYATTRSDNVGMKKILFSCGFQKCGTDYKSARTSVKLSLFTLCKDRSISN